jgi:hypothetical protein
VLLNDFPIHINEDLSTSGKVHFELTILQSGATCETKVATRSALTREGIRTDQSIAVAAECKMDRRIGRWVRSSLEFADIARDQGVCGLEPVVVNSSLLQAADAGLYGVVRRRTSGSCKQCGNSTVESSVLADLHINRRRLEICFVFSACPDDRIVGGRVACSDPEEGYGGGGTSRFKNATCDERQSYDSK